jgi:hypothetical protein
MRLALLSAAAGAKHSSDAAAREQLEKVVEVLVSGECSAVLQGLLQRLQWLLLRPLLREKLVGVVECSWKRLSRCWSVVSAVLLLRQGLVLQGLLGKEVGVLQCCRCGRCAGVAGKKCCGPSGCMSACNAWVPAALAQACRCAAGARVAGRG